jgi:hypothetical protein
MTKRNGRLAAAAILSTGLTTAALAADPIKLGVIVPTSGGAASVGLPIVDGIKLAVQEINAAGGVNGSKIEIVVRDEQLKPDVATAAAKELITKEGVKAIIGAATSATSLAVSEVAKAEKIIAFTPTAKTEALTDAKLHKYIFQYPSTTDVDGKRKAAIIADKLGAKSLCLTGLNYAYTTDLFKSVKANLPTSVKVSNEYLFEIGTTDFNTTIGKLMADPCDTILGSVFGGSFISFAKQAAPFGLFKNKKLVWASQMGDYTMSATLKGDFPEGLWSSAVDVWYFDGTPAHKAFQEGLAKIQGKKETDMWPLAGYMTTRLLVAAIKKAGSTDPDKMVEALEGLTLESPLGPVTVDPKTHRVAAPEFYGPVVTVPGESVKRMSPVTLVR